MYWCVLCCAVLCCVVCCDVLCCAVLCCATPVLIAYLCRGLVPLAACLDPRATCKEMDADIPLIHVTFVHQDIELAELEDEEQEEQEEVKRRRRRYKESATFC